MLPSYLPIHPNPREDITSPQDHPSEHPALSSSLGFQSVHLVANRQPSNQTESGPYLQSSLDFSASFEAGLVYELILLYSFFPILYGSIHRRYAVHSRLFERSQALDVGMSSSTFF